MKEIEEQIVDYIQGELSESESRELEQLIASNQEYQALLEEYKEMSRLMKEPVHQPGNAWKNQMIGQLLKTELGEKNTDKGSLIVNLRNYLPKIAAAAAILIIGYLGITNMQQQTLMQQVDEDLVALRTQIENNLQQGNSVSQRIMAVNYSDQIAHEDIDIINVLTHTLSTDKSAHVRLTAVNALGRWVQNKSVEESFIEQLKVESDPSVKISLIQMLSSIASPAAQEEFETLIQNDATPKFIKEEVYKGQIRKKTTNEIL